MPPLTAVSSESFFIRTTVAFKFENNVSNVHVRLWTPAARRYHFFPCPFRISHGKHRTYERRLALSAGQGLGRLGIVFRSVA